ncbi:MAG: RNA-directed DNA polymerase, partial [bacterium]
MLNLQNQSLDWAIKNIKKHGDTDVFPRPFEIAAILENWDEVKAHLRGLDVCTPTGRVFRKALIPKSRFGFRISTQLDPLDSIIYNAILFEMFDDFENARVPREQNVAFSFRLKPTADGSLYDPDYTWSTFKQKENRLAKSGDYGFVVITDIADFYPSIYLHYIETVLEEITKTSGRFSHANAFIELIKSMNYKQTHRGVPIGPQFSRCIAELLLDQIDRILLKKNLYFIRFVDDFRIYCKTESEAYSALTFLAQKLYDLFNLKINAQKTEITDIKDYLEKHAKTEEDDEREVF